MYSDQTAALRRCQGMTKRGDPCQQWAVWGDTRCIQHGGHRVNGHGKTRYIPCTCVAYAWPHRPAGGLCRWPDPPRWRSLTSPGTHCAPKDIRALAQRLAQADRRDHAHLARHWQEHHRDRCPGEGCHYCAFVATQLITGA